LRNAGWVVNFKRVERIWRREGLKVPHKQPKIGRLWLNAIFDPKREFRRDRATSSPGNTFSNRFASEPLRNGDFARPDASGLPLSTWDIEVE
jgi:hypothetical protein